MTTSGDEHSDSGDGETTGQTTGETQQGISDEQLPEDLQPTDDNPLAKPPGEESDDDAEGEQPTSSDLPDMGDPGAAG